MSPHANFTAADARQLVKESPKHHYNAQLEQLINRICTAARVGEEKIILEQECLPEVVKRLEELGYKVKAHNLLSKGEISW